MACYVADALCLNLRWNFGLEEAETMVPVPDLPVLQLRLADQLLKRVSGHHDEFEWV